MSKFDAESAVLGGCLLEPQAYWKVADVLAVEDFSTEQNRMLWSGISRLRKEGVDADVVTISERWPNVASLVIDLANNTPGASNVRAYARIVADAATERRVNDAGIRIGKLKGAGVLGEAQALLAGCMRRTLAGVRKLTDLYLDAYRGILSRYEAGDEMTGLATGFTDIDEMTAGLQPAELIIIAARPSIGKTALAAQICMTVARTKKVALLVSMEMSASALTERCISHIAKIDGMKLRRPKRMTDAEWTRLHDAKAEFDALAMFIDDVSRSIDQVCAKAHQMKSTEGLDLLAIDYLQLFDLPDAETVAEATQLVTRALKQLAKTLGIPVMLLSQLTREGDTKPELRHLRNSGAIEQDADLAMLMHRPDKKKPDVVMVNIAKQRNGPTGEVYLESNMAISAFSNSNYDPPAAKAKEPQAGFDDDGDTTSAGSTGRGRWGN